MLRSLKKVADCELCSLWREVEGENLLNVQLSSHFSLFFFNVLVFARRGNTFRGGSWRGYKVRKQAVSYNCNGVHRFQTFLKEGVISKLQPFWNPFFYVWPKFLWMYNLLRWQIFPRGYTLCTVMGGVKIDSVTRTPEGGLPNSKNSTSSVQFINFYWATTHYLETCWVLSTSWTWKQHSRV